MFQRTTKTEICFFFMKQGFLRNNEMGKLIWTQNDGIQRFIRVNVYSCGRSSLLATFSAPHDLIFEKC